MKTDDEGGELFDGAVPGFFEGGTRFGKSVGYGSGSRVKRVNGLEGFQNVNMGCSSWGCRRISLKGLQDGDENLKCIGQSSRVDGRIQKSTTLTTFEAKVLRSNG